MADCHASNGYVPNGKKELLRGRKTVSRHVHNKNLNKTLFGFGIVCAIMKVQQQDVRSVRREDLSYEFFL